MLARWGRLPPPPPNHFFSLNPWLLSPLDSLPCQPYTRGLKRLHPSLGKVTGIRSQKMTTVPVPGSLWLHFCPKKSKIISKKKEFFHKINMK